MKMYFQHLVISLALLTSALTSWGAIIVQSPVGQNTAFTVLSNDLLQTNVSSTANNLTLNVGENNAAGATTAAVLTNGNFGNGAVPLDLAGREESHVIDFGQITYNLDISVNTGGYDITSIETYAGWADLNRGTQAYTVEISTVGNAGFSTLATVTFNKDSFTQEKISISEDTTGILATGVDAIRFDFGSLTGSQEFSGVGYKELDVSGMASAIPEPTSLTLLGSSLLLVIMFGRKRRSSALSCPQ